MSDIENKKTTPKQKVLIMLITAVLLLLAVQTIGTGDQVDPELPDDRESCLSSGFIWSQSAERCYNSSMANTPVDTKSVQLGVGDSDVAGEVAITLREIVTDDRCPINRECTRRGAVVAGVTLERDGARVEPNIISDQAAYSFDGRDIMLQFVEPTPTMESTITSDDYVLTFWVTAGTSSVSL